MKYPWTKKWETRMIKIVVLSVLITCCISFSVAKNSQEREYVDALDVVQKIISMRAPIISMYQEGEECLFTSPPVEDVVRDYARYHQGGTDRCAIARALDDLSFALSIVIDADESQSLTHEEVLDFAAQTLDSNGIEVLLCLAVAYEDIPRK